MQSEECRVKNEKPFGLRLWFSLTLHSALLIIHFSRAPFIKTRSTRSLRRLQLKIRLFCDYAEQIGQLEKALARNRRNYNSTSSESRRPESHHIICTLNQASSRSGSSPERSCAWADSVAVRFRRLADNQLHGLELGEIPNTARSSDRRASAARRPLCENSSGFSRCRTVVCCSGLPSSGIIGNS